MGLKPKPFVICATPPFGIQFVNVITSAPLILRAVIMDD